MNIAIVGWVDPYARYRYEGLRFELKSGALGASIKVGEFNEFGKRMTLRIERSEDKGTRLLGIFTALDDKAGTQVAATAAEGQFLSTDDPDTIIFRLKNGTAGPGQTRSSPRRGHCRSKAMTCRSTCPRSIPSAAAAMRRRS